MSSSPRRGRRGSGPRPSKGAKSNRPAPTDLDPILDPPDIPNFAHFGLDPGILQGITNMGIEKPTPIQALSIQPILDGKDLIAKAETGTGKTLAFGAPIMSKVDAERSTVLALVLCPTRELAQQVAGVMAALAMPRGIKVVLVVGGDPIHPQVQELQQGAQVVVGTPGRVLDLHQQRFLQFPWTEFAVLDEADKMFEIGFLDDVRKILALLPEERQTLLFSATYPREVLGLARDFTTDPVEVATALGLATVASIDQGFMRFADEQDRALALVRMVEQSEEDDVFLVFCDRRTDVDRLLRRLEREPFPVKALHGGYDQASRFRVMSAFRAAEVKVLLATDVAARGLDVEHVTHVVNFSVPRDTETYTHRIGRTGRAGRDGRSITFVQPADRRRWQAILDTATWDISELDEPSSTRRSGPPRSRDRGGRGEQDRGTRGGSSRGPRGARERTAREDAARAERPKAAKAPATGPAFGELDPDAEPRVEAPAEPAQPPAAESQPAPRERTARTPAQSPERAQPQRESSASDERAPKPDRERPRRGGRDRQDRREPRRETAGASSEREREVAQAPRERDEPSRDAEAAPEAGTWKRGQRGAKPPGWTGQRARPARD